MGTGKAGPSDQDSIEVRDSPVHGRGVFALRALRAGEAIGRYAGRRYPSEAAFSEVDPQLTYLFGLSDGSLIDGADGGNATRHLNHACEPNVAAHERWRRGRLGIVIVALRDIAPGEELFLDYALAIDGDPADYRCRCGAARCRGTMAAPTASTNPPDGRDADAARAVDCAA